MSDLIMRFWQLYKAVHPNCTALSCLYHPRHIRRQINDPVLLFQISGMQHIGDMCLFGVFPAEFVKRGKGVILSRFHFDRRNVVSVAYFALDNKEVYTR